MSPDADGRYSNTLNKLHQQFCRWFKDLKKKWNEIQLLMCRLSSNVERTP
jgi:hypothetical protein